METLADRIARDGPLNELDAVGWIIRLAKRLEAIHALGVAHGSVTPACVLTEGVPRTSKGVLSDMMRTSDDPAFQSPERLAGGSVSQLDDVWALGATLYTALTATQPYGSAAAAEVEQKIAAGAPAPLAVFDVGDDDLQRIIDDVLTRDAERRLTTVAGLRRELEKWHPDPGVKDLPPLDEEDSTDDGDDDARTVMRAGPAELAPDPRRPRPAAGAPLPRPGAPFPAPAAPLPRPAPPARPPAPAAARAAPAKDDDDDDGARTMMREPTPEAAPARRAGAPGTPGRGALPAPRPAAGAPAPDSMAPEDNPTAVVNTADLLRHAAASDGDDDDDARTVMRAALDDEDSSVAATIMREAPPMAPGASPFGPGGPSSPRAAPGGGPEAARPGAAPPGGPMFPAPTPPLPMSPPVPAGVAHGYGPGPAPMTPGPHPHGYPAGPADGAMPPQHPGAHAPVPPGALQQRAEGGRGGIIVVLLALLIATAAGTFLFLRYRPF